MGLARFLRNLFGGGESDEDIAARWSAPGPDPSTSTKRKKGLLGTLFADKGFTVEELARRLDLRLQELQNFKPVYQEFTIPKRSGGSRRISAPNPELKTLQRRILKRLLARLKCHPAVHGFEKGCSILTNALPHTGREVVIHMDIKDFFPSTNLGRVAAFYRRIGWNKEATALLVKLTTHKGGLPQGAPTSPRLANLVNLRMDARLGGVGRRFGARYTRYADDLTFSFPKGSRYPVGMVLCTACFVVGEEGYALHKRRKMHVRRPHQQQRVTGLVVNERPRLPRKTRRWLRAVEHRMKTTGSATLTPEQLAGWHALQSMIEEQTAS